jgi:hypothetical protein
LENKKITYADCEKLYNRFMDYTETAEQHEFARLFMINTMLNSTLEEWHDPINQKEARAMFRVVLKTIGGDITPYLEEKENASE